MNRLKPVLLILILSLGCSFNTDGQTSPKLGFYVSPGLSYPIQGPNTFISRDYVPGFGLEFGGLVDVEFHDNWKVRSGIGVFGLRYRENFGFFVFENQIDPTLGRIETGKNVYAGITVPLLVAYRKKESIIGVVGGANMLFPIHNKLIWNYSNATIEETTTSLSFIPAVSLGVQLSFPVGAKESRLELEPIGRLCLRTLKYNDDNLLTFGLRIVFIK